MEHEVSKDPTLIPYFAHEEMMTRLAFSHEGDMDRMDRVNKRLAVALVLTIVLIFLSNAIWLYEWMQYDYFGYDEETTTTSYEQDGSGINVMGNHNEVNHGAESESYSDEAEYEDTDSEIIPGK